MTKKQYNIIWGDDEINDILTDGLREYLADLGIAVINTFTNAEDLGIFLEMHKEEIDAVITDANYSYDRNNKVDPDPNLELKTSGLQHIMELKKTYPNKLFFLCTQRKQEKLRERFNDGELIPFEGKIFDKTMEDYEIFFPEIVKEIEERQTPEFIIRNRYHKELEIADCIDYKYDVNGRTYRSNAGKDILKWLVDDYKGTLCNTHLYFNPIRKILEELQRYLATSSIIPSYISLTDFAKFCKHKQGELISQTDYVEINGNRTAIQRYYALTKNLKDWAHPTLMRVFSYLLDITQDASHRSGSLSYKIDEYTRAHKDRCHVFHSVLHSMLEVLNWCYEIVKSPQFKNHWFGDLYGETVDIQDDSGNWFVDKILLKPANVECIADINDPVTIGVVTRNNDPETNEKYPLFFPMPGLIGVVKNDRNGLFVYDSIVRQDDIQEGDKVKIINATPEYSRSGDNKRVVTVEKTGENPMVENDMSGGNTTNETTPSTPGTIVENTAEENSLNKTHDEKTEKEFEDTGTEDLHHPLINTIVAVEKKDGKFYADGIFITEPQGLKHGDKILIQSIESINESDDVITKAIKTFENYPKKILSDSEGNWYVGSSLVKSSKTRSVENPPCGEFLIGKVGINKGLLKGKYPLIVRGLLIENINVAVFPGYILEVKQRDSVLTASNCLVEGENIKEGDTVVVKDVVSNGDSTTNKMYKAKLIVELYKEESDGNKECKETTE